MPLATPVPPFDAIPGLVAELWAWWMGIEKAVVHFVACDLYVAWLDPILLWMQEKTVALPLALGALVALGLWRPRRALRATLAIALGVGVAMLIASFCWTVIPRDRPPQVFARTLETPAELAACDRYPDALPLRKHRSVASSFPSRHSLTAGVFAVVILLAWRWAGCVSVPYGVLVAYGRVYAGKHWASDVVVGLLLGAALGWWAWWFVPRIFARWGRSNLVDDPSSSGG